MHGTCARADQVDGQEGIEVLSHYFAIQQNRIPRVVEQADL